MLTSGTSLGVSSTVGRSCLGARGSAMILPCCADAGTTVTQPNASHSAKPTGLATSAGDALPPPLPPCTAPTSSEATCHTRSARLKTRR